MAQVVTTVDDLDPSQAATTTRVFSVGNKSYELDLCAANADEFDDAMAQWIQAARRVPKTTDGAAAPSIEPVPVVGDPWYETPPRPFGRGTQRRFVTARRIVRKWARANGWPGLGDRGRIPQVAYDAWTEQVWSAHPSWEAVEAMAAETAEPEPEPKPRAKRRPRK